ncbi:hypothetical protein ACLMJK_003217 [Lecanora helva]
MTEGRTTTSLQSLSGHESTRFSNPNIFSDDFALEPLELTDRHRTASTDRNNIHDASETPRRSLSLQQALESPTGSLRRDRGSERSEDRPNSIMSRMSRLSHSPRSLTSISDSGNTASTQHRSVRTNSTFGFPRAQSPYQGATGPSQPYGMYSQNIGMTRTPSTATTSTIRRPERSYSGPSRPTQPYGMYAQNTVPEHDGALAAGLAPPAVAGLPGQHRDFQRRLGPEGEDVDDLIGPDGYTEQLPPYSRYANGVPPKYTSGLGAIDQRSASILSIAEPQGTRQDTHPRNAELIDPFNDSSTQISPSSSGTIPPKHEDTSFKERVRRKGKRKVCCGIPCWYCIVMIIVVFFAVLLGGLIGGVVAHKHGEQKSVNGAIAAPTVTAPPIPAATVTVSPPPDAISLTSTPSNLPPLPTGTFAVTLDEPNAVKDSCLTNKNQASAWDCATGARLSMEVQIMGSRPLVSLSYPQPPSPSIRYGAQPPQLGGQVPLVMMSDKYESTKGPAYLFTQQYNKTVIVHNQDIPGGVPTNSKRSFLKRWFSKHGDTEDRASIYGRDSDDSDWTDNSIAVPGDKPWYCYWPGTILEGFIYITEDVDEDDDGFQASSSAAASTSAPSSLSDSVNKRQAPQNLQPYPKVVKIEERRNPFPIKPYCQEMQILNTNEPGLVTDQATGQLIQVQLDESESVVQHQFNPVGSWGPAAPSSIPSFPAFPTGIPGRKRATERRDLSGTGSACQCQWIDD